jgi:hypothetical protein
MVGLAVVGGSDLWGGSYELASCGNQDTGYTDCQLFVFPTQGTVGVNGIIHSQGYDGTTGPAHLTIRVCTVYDELRGPLKRAIATWNALVPRQETCENCQIFEDMSSPQAPLKFDAESVLLHELGHCAFGLAHIGRPWHYLPSGQPNPLGFQPTSFALSTGVVTTLSTGIQARGDGVRGSRDDWHCAPSASCGTFAESLTWHDNDFNNPFLINYFSEIDNTDYTRSVVAVNAFPNPPPPAPKVHFWGETANKAVGVLRNFPNTQVTCPPKTGAVIMSVSPAR